MSGYEFDFGSGMPLPPSKYKHEHYEDISHATFNGGYHQPPFRSLARCADVKLLDYLRARNVSPAFLIEIDKFLEAHPEIKQHKPEFADDINYGPPLDSYLRFVTGYTRPARYVEGVLPLMSEIPIMQPQKLVEKRDPELDTFFNGFEYRFDILEKIDHEVEHLMHELYVGHQVTYAQRKLVFFAVYGNLVDAYKFYEYNYQTEWLPHRYLAEHVVLTELPKPADSEAPIPRQIAYPDEDCQEERRSHPGTRQRMARACDAGVDVIDVLLDDFTAVLCRKGLNREEIERMRREAVRNIDHERQIARGRDIVDMVMDRARAVQPPPLENAGKRTRARINRVHRLDGLKHSLYRLYAQEDTLQYDASFVRDTIMTMRQRVEREFVAEIILLAVKGGSMKQDEMMYWRKLFTKDTQIKREHNGHRIDVLQVFEKYL